MLAKIEVNDFTIKMKSENHNNIYDIDSLNLLIGKNGSGKTKALCEIVSHFCIQNDDFYNHNCRFYDENDIQINGNQLSDLGLIYFTSLPFKPKFSAHSKKFIDASSKINGYSANFNFLKHKKILSSFNINPKIVAKSNFSKMNVCRLLIQICIDDSNDDFLENDFQINTSKIKDLQLRLEKSTIDLNSKNVTTKNKSIIVSHVKLLQSEIKNRTDHLCYYLFEEILRCNDEISTFAAFAVAEKMISKKESNEEILQALHNSLILPNIPFKRRINASTNTVTDEIKFLSQSIHKLRGSQGFDDFYDQYNDSPDRFIFELEIDPYLDELFQEQRFLKSYFSFQFKNISSGEMALLSQIVLLSEAVSFLKKRCKSVLILIDEGDAFLHLEWQRVYVSTLNRIMGQLKNDLSLESLQIILASHSPLLATDFPRDFICRLDENNASTPLGFAAPLYALLSDSFGTNTIGEFSAMKINNIIEKIKNRSLDENDMSLISYIDNPLIKSEIKRLIDENVIETEL